MHPGSTRATAYYLSYRTMKISRRLLASSWILAIAGLLHAQTPSPAPAEPSPTTPPAAAAPSTTAARDRPISNRLAASIAEAMPTYSPPPPTPEPSPDDNADQPRNRIIRLPQVVVEGERPPVFTEREVYTSRGLAEVAMRRYLSELDRGVLNRFTIPFLGATNEARALAQYAENERLRQMSAANDQISFLRQTNPAEAARFQEIARDTFIRTPYLPTPASLKRD